MFYTATPKDSQQCYIYHNSEKTALPGDNAYDTRYFAGMSDNILIMPDQVMYTTSSKTVKALTDSQSFDIQSAIARANSEMPGISSTVPDGVAVLASTSIQATTLTYGVYTSFCFCPSDINEGEFVHISMDVEVEDASGEDYENFKSGLKEGLFVKITSIRKVSHFTLQGDKSDIFFIGFDEGTINTKDYEKIYITSITIEKRVPDLEHMCTYGNRVWGVEGNSIRCSLLGDPSIWYDFSADTFGTLPSSCYSVEVDSGGKFTAICAYNGNILAFKEDCVHKIYGSEPENYTLYTQSMIGVQMGAHNTLVNINGVLYYKGTDGFYAYSGGLPVCISDKLSNNFEAIASGTDGKNYYTIIREDGVQKILVYYTDQKLWHKENADNEFLFVESANNLYSVSPNQITNMASDSCAQNTEWSFEYEFDEGTFNCKRYSRLLIKYSLDKGGYFTVKTTCDDNIPLVYINGDFEPAKNGESIIILPQIKCTKIRVKFEGKGNFTLKNLTREYFLLKEGGN